MNEDFFNRTAGGGVITLISSLIMATLFLSELRECQAAQFANHRCYTLHQSSTDHSPSCPADVAFAGQVT